LHVPVALVVDLADDLLDQVLHGDDAVDGATLVDDQGELLALDAQLAHGVGHLERLGEEQRLEHVVADRALRGDQVTQVDDAEHVVEAHRAGHRSARVATLDEPGQCFGGRQVGREDQHVAARDEDLAQDPVGDLEGAADDVALLGGDVLLGSDHVADLLGADLLTAGVRVAAGQAHDQVGGLAEQPDDRARHGGQHVERAGDQHGPALGPLHGDALGRQLTDDQGEEGENEGDEEDRHRPRGVAEEAEGFDQWLCQ
jgi:hypothetical protein